MKITIPNIFKGSQILDPSYQLNSYQLFPWTHAMWVPPRRHWGCHRWDCGDLANHTEDATGGWVTTVSESRQPRQQLLIIADKERGTWTSPEDFVFYHLTGRASKWLDPHLSRLSLCSWKQFNVSLCKSSNCHRNAGAAQLQHFAPVGHVEKVPSDFVRSVEEKRGWSSWVRLNWDLSKRRLWWVIENPNDAKD